MDRPRSELTCREVVDFLSDYLDGDLGAEQRREFEAHLVDCDQCVTYVRQYEQTVALGKEAFDRPDDPASSQHVPSELVAAILAACRKR